MKLILAVILSVLTSTAALQARASGLGEGLERTYSKQTLTQGSMDVFATADGSRVKSIFTATNGIVIILDSTRNSHEISVGELSLSLTRLASGGVRVVSNDSGRRSTRVYSRNDLGGVKPVDLESAFDPGAGAMSDGELVAYSEYVAFLQSNQPRADIVVAAPDDGGESSARVSLKCGLYVVGTGIIGVASAEACVASLGWTCAAGVVGTLMAWDATMAVCGL